MTDEQTLIRSAKDGDMEAFRLLVEQSRLNVYRLAYDMTSNKHDAEDMLQEVYIKAYRSLNQFRGDCKWSSWLYRITVNTCYDHYKKKKETMELQDGFDQETGSRQGSYDAENPEIKTESAMIQENINRALNALTSRERSVFVLRHYHDLPLKQVAQILEIREGTVKTLLFRGLQKLQRELAFYKKDFYPRGI